VPLLLLGMRKKRKNESNIAAILGASATIGYEGVTVGAQVTGDGNQQLATYGVGLQYERDSFVAAVLTEHQTESKEEVIKASWVHRVSPTYTTGVEVAVDDRKKVVSFVSDFLLDSGTGLKLRGSNAGDLAAAIERRLRDPRVAVLLSASWKLKGTSQNLKADKFGIGLTFGDY